MGAFTPELFGQFFLIGPWSPRYVQMDLTVCEQQSHVVQNKTYEPRLLREGGIGLLRIDPWSRECK